MDEECRKSIARYLRPRIEAAKMIIESCEERLPLPNQIFENLEMAKKLKEQGARIIDKADIYNLLFIKNSYYICVLRF